MYDSKNYVLSHDREVILLKERREKAARYTASGRDRQGQQRCAQQNNPDKHQSDDLGGAEPPFFCPSQKLFILGHRASLLLVIMVVFYLIIAVLHLFASRFLQKKREYRSYSPFLYFKLVLLLRIKVL